jgi:hypothetical protein
MKGYLMQEKKLLAGQDTFIESVSPENNYGVVFEDDGETAYFYALERDPTSQEPRILDALHIYQTEETGVEDKTPQKLMIIWSRDWMKAALVIDGRCHGLFDFKEHGGYNINEFPPPAGPWTKRGRKLTNELLSDLF